MHWFQDDSSPEDSSLDDSSQKYIIDYYYIYVVYHFHPASCNTINIFIPHLVGIILSHFHPASCSITNIFIINHVITNIFSASCNNNEQNVGSRTGSGMKMFIVLCKKRDEIVMNHALMKRQCDESSGDESSGDESSGDETSAHQ